MPLTDYRTLGRSGLRVSPLCLGAMTFGEEWGWGSDEPTSRRILDAFFDRGGNFIDTADIYTKGHSEAIIGGWLNGDANRRDRAVIATKFCGVQRPDDPNAGGAGRKHMMSALEQSLRRLRTDYIDLYWMHIFDGFTPIEETIRAMDDAVRAGKVRYVGFSDTPAWLTARAHTLAQVHNMAPVIALQVEYSLLERGVEGEIVPMARELGMGLTPWSPLKGGALSGKYRRDNRDDWDKADARRAVNPEKLDERALTVIDQLQKIANAHGATIAQAALAWLRSRETVDSIIIGARTMEQLEANLDSLSVSLKPEELRALSDLTAPSLDFPAPFVNRMTAFTQGGTTVNGRRSEPFPLAPSSDNDRW